MKKAGKVSGTSRRGTSSSASTTTSRKRKTKVGSEEEEEEEPEEGTCEQEPGQLRRSKRIRVQKEKKSEEAKKNEEEKGKGKEEEKEEEEEEEKQNEKKKKKKDEKKKVRPKLSRASNNLLNASYRDIFGLGTPGVAAEGDGGAEQEKHCVGYFIFFEITNYLAFFQVPLLLFFFCIFFGILLFPIDISWGRWMGAGSVGASAATPLPAEAHARRQPAHRGEAQLLLVERDGAGRRR